MHSCQRAPRGWGSTSASTARMRRCCGSGNARSRAAWRLWLPRGQRSSRSPDRKKPASWGHRGPGLAAGEAGRAVSVSRPSRRAARHDLHCADHPGRIRVGASGADGRTIVRAASLTSCLSPVRARLPTVRRPLEVRLARAFQPPPLPAAQGPPIRSAHRTAECREVPESPMLSPWHCAQNVVKPTEESPFSGIFDSVRKESSLITVTAVREGVDVAVSVADQGRGIPAESLPHLFRKFSRAPSEEQDSGPRKRGSTYLGQIRGRVNLARPGQRSTLCSA